LAFAAAAIPDRQLWFKGETLWGTEGATVSNWVSSAMQSGWYATQTISANWPTLTNTFNGAAGVKAVWCDGTARILSVTAPGAKALLQNAESATFVAVAHQWSSGTTKILVFFSNGISDNATRDAFGFDTSERGYMASASMDGDSVTGLSGSAELSTNAAFCLMADFVHTNTVEQTGSSLTYYTNGVLYVTGAGSTPTNTSATASQVIYLLRGNASSQRFYGALAEVQVFVPKLTEAQRTAVWAELKPKYNL